MGSSEFHTDFHALLSKQQEKYLIDINNGVLIYRQTPHTISYNKIYSFPFIKYFCPVSHLYKVFSEISRERIELSHEPYTVAGIQIDNTKFFWEHITITKNHRGFYFTMLVDYFQEECRLKCRRVNAKNNFLSFFNQNRYNIEWTVIRDKKRINYLNLIDVAFKIYEPCSEFNPIWLTNMIYIFEKHIGKITNMLDMSAGRGARMLACAALGINYLGIDPCECTNAKYDLMKKFARFCGSNSHIQFIKSGFEDDWKLPSAFKDKQFDLMFSSPPYFDLEIYEDTPGQSIKKFNNLENWLENFLKVSMIKIFSLLRPGGILALNIDNPVHIKRDYINPMLKFEFDNAKFIGVIRIFRGAKFHTWCWQKK
jgi:tRNA1(Val) A37 N6-methylase TrmN6